MGIFSFFGKKDKVSSGQPPGTTSSPDDGASPHESSRTSQRQPLRMTAERIDAIESEMTSELSQPLPFSGNTLPPIPDLPFSAAPQSSSNASNTIAATPSHTPHETRPGPIALCEATPVIEEVAMLFANGETGMIEPILQQAIREDTAGNAPVILWGMLFDLYQLTQQRASFDELALIFIERFERSPPAWIEQRTEGTGKTPPLHDHQIPELAFSGKLDAGIIRQLERLQNLCNLNQVVRLEFSRINTVDPVGCGLLLNVLTRVQKNGNQLILNGSTHLSEKIHAILAPGRRDETEAPWLLLLELLRHQNREQEFEETCINYSITFEVSPPAFIASPPARPLQTNHANLNNRDALHVQFDMLPIVNTENASQLQQIHAFIRDQQPAILDCTRLVRMDFAAASQLISATLPLIDNGKIVELHNANHFIAALFHIMDSQGKIRILSRKN